MAEISGHPFMTVANEIGQNLGPIEIKDLDGSDIDYKYTRVINLKEDGRHVKAKNKKANQNSTG